MDVLSDSFIFHCLIVEQFLSLVLPLSLVFIIKVSFSLVNLIQLMFQIVLMNTNFGFIAVLNQIKSVVDLGVYGVYP